MAENSKDDVGTEERHAANTQGRDDDQLDGGHGKDSRSLKTSFWKRLVNVIRGRNKIKFDKVIWRNGSRGGDKVDGEPRGLKRLARSLGVKLRQKCPEDEDGQLRVSTDDAKSPRGTSQEQSRPSTAATSGTNSHVSELPAPLASHPVTATGRSHVPQTLDPIQEAPAATGASPSQILSLSPPESNPRVFVPNGSTFEE